MIQEELYNVLWRQCYKKVLQFLPGASRRNSTPIVRHTDGGWQAKAAVHRSLHNLPLPPRCVVLGLVQILWSNLIEKQILSFRGPIVQLQSIKIQRSIISHPPTNPNNTNVQSIWKCLFLPPENPVRGGRISPPSACTLLWFGRSTPTYLTNELTN